jgi:hypothetical protein
MSTNNERARLLEYLLASPILGLPCIAITPAIADLTGIPFAIALIVSYFGALGLYQIKRTQLVPSYNRYSYVCGAVVALGFTSLTLYWLLQTNAQARDSGPFPSLGTVRASLMVMWSFFVGYFFGLGVLFFGFAKRTHKPLRVTE